MVCTVTMNILSLNCGGNFSLGLYLSAPIFIFTYLSQKILPPSDYKKPQNIKYIREAAISDPGSAKKQQVKSIKATMHLHPNPTLIASDAIVLRMPTEDPPNIEFV